MTEPILPPLKPLPIKDRISERLEGHSYLFFY